jgi:hypothetical protein
MLKGSGRNKPLPATYRRSGIQASRKKGLIRIAWLASKHMDSGVCGAAGFVGKPFVAVAVLEKIAAALKGATP